LENFNTEFMIGLKLWSNNECYGKEIDRLWNNGIFNYIELYIVPDSKKFIESWRNKKVPYIIHCPHSYHGFNLSDIDKEISNEILFSEALDYFNQLNARYLIIHPGVYGNRNETARQINLLLHKYHIKDSSKIMIENKPLITLKDEICTGSSPEYIRFIKDSCNIGFCLDIIHSIKYAIASKLDIYIILREFMNMCPAIMHLSDGFTDNSKDEHLHLGKGVLDFKKIFSFCSSPYITIETVKDSKCSLADFEEDVAYLRKVLENG